ncbi:MAG: MogA/MoaB family molybdenum cofactor biosynthesis protein [Chloroflexi bacterium]|nr:MogA/MoaB family molybdenum cofactor biosynthesis protein [Chloroflexota bacterium]
MIRVGVLTISDKGFAGEREDKSGQEIKDALRSLPEARVEAYQVIPDEQVMISETLCRWADEDHLDLILTTGGTGLSPRDVTPEATAAVVDRLVPGMAEAMREEGRKKNARAMLSRGIAGARAHTLIVNLPGSPKAVREGLEVVLPVVGHAIEILQARPTDHG